jgi:DNA-binding transcriptional LysR family regulator
METRYYETLIAIVEFGSFSGAAAAQHITQSTASRRIAVLEQQFGCSLLDRDGPTVVPTECGRVVVERARRIVSAEQDLRARIAQLGCAPHINLGCTSVFAATHLSCLLQHVSRLDLAGHISVSTGVTSALLAGVEHGDYDVVFVEHCGHPGVGTLESRDLGEDEVLFVSAGTDLAAGDVDLAELLPHVVLTCQRQCCSHVLLESNLHKSGHRIDDFAGVIEVEDLSALRRMVQDTGRLAFVSSNIVATELTAGDLVAHSVEGWQHRRSRAVVARDAETLATWHSMYIEAVAQERIGPGCRIVAG